MCSCVFMLMCIHDSLLLGKLALCYSFGIQIKFLMHGYKFLHCGHVLEVRLSEGNNHVCPFARCLISVMMTNEILLENSFVILISTNIFTKYELDYYLFFNGSKQNPYKGYLSSGVLSSTEQWRGVMYYDVCSLFFNIYFRRSRD